jgi:hypothetical protein
MDIARGLSGPDRVAESEELPPAPQLIVIVRYVVGGASSVDD